MLPVPRLYPCTATDASCAPAPPSWCLPVPLDDAASLRKFPKSPPQLRHCLPFCCGLPRCPTSHGRLQNSSNARLPLPLRWRFSCVPLANMPILVLSKKKPPRRRFLPVRSSNEYLRHRCRVHRCYLPRYHIPLLLNRHRLRYLRRHTCREGSFPIFLVSGTKIVLLPTNGIYGHRT